MQMNYPKFDKKIKETIDTAYLQQPRTRPGIVVAFDKNNNTATVVLDDHNSELVGSAIGDVPCPVTKGVQSVSPSIGTRCLVAFRDTNESSPYILNFFEDTKRNMNYAQSYTVDTGVPRFLVH
jgi:hypothetical protein